MQQHHFFAATGYGWATGDTRQEAIARLANDMGEPNLARAVKHHGGLFVQSFRVELPGNAPYEISMYRPVGVPISAKQVHKIVDVSGNLAACEEG